MRIKKHAQQENKNTTFWETGKLQQTVKAIKSFFLQNKLLIKCNNNRSHVILRLYV